MSGVAPVARRLLVGLRGDRRTVGLVLVAPVFIIFLVSEVFQRPERVAPIILGVVVFVLTYMLTAIGFLRERTSGTLERLLVAPVSRVSLVLGYVVGYGVLATVQAAVLLGAGIYFLEVEVEHGLAPFFALAVLGALTALGLGIALSLFADTEFQAIQFVPVVITPQVVLGETFVPVEALPWYLEYPAMAMPVTYVVRGMNYVVLDAGEPADLWWSVGALVGFALAAIVASAAILRLRT